MEILKYPYYGKSIESKEFLSDKICSTTIRVRKKIITKAKCLVVYGDFILRLTNGVVPSQAIGLPILPPTSSIMRSIHSNIPKKVIIARVIHNNPEKILFTEKQIDQFYDLGVKYKNNSMSIEEVILELRGGDIQDWVAAFGVVMAIIVVLNNLNYWNYVEGFQVPQVPIVPPHLQGLYGNQQPGNHFGYGKGAGPKSLIVTGLTQNAGSEKKEPSSGSYNYIDVVKELKKQSRKKMIDIQVGDQIYSIKNSSSPYIQTDIDKLEALLAEKIYDSIRESDMDICDIASNLGFKADNIKNVKDHVFNNKHILDRYKETGALPEYRRFDPDLNQALAWKRLEAGTHNQNDVTWIKHECAERHHELKYGSGYSEAHDRAQSLYNGSPWQNEF